MAFAVDLSLAAPAAAALDALCDRLEEDSGIDTYRRLGNAPHISLAVYDKIEPEAFGDTAAAFASRIKALSIRLNAIGAFCHEKSVLFAAPVVMRPLLELHEDFHRAFAAFNVSCWDYYRPGNWVPHVTLAVNLTPAALAQAMKKLAPLWRERDALLDRMRLISFPPFRLLFEHELAAERLG